MLHYYVNSSVLFSTCTGTRYVVCLLTTLYPVHVCNFLGGVLISENFREMLEDILVLLKDKAIKKWCKDHLVPLSVFVPPVIFLVLYHVYPDYWILWLQLEGIHLVTAALFSYYNSSYVCYWESIKDTLRGGSEDTDSAVSSTSGPSGQIISILKKLLLMAGVFAMTVVTGVTLVCLLSKSGVICVHAEQDKPPDVAGQGKPPDVAGQDKSPDVDTLSHNTYTGGGQAMDGGDTGSGSVQNETFLLSDQTRQDTQGNLVMEASEVPGTEVEDCIRVNREDHKSLSRNHLLNKLPYRVESDVYELNLVKRLAEDSHWKGVAKFLDMNPSAILDNYKESSEELMESSRKLFDKIYDKGYNGKFDFDAYIAAFKKTGELDGIIDDLVNMLKCNSISRTRPEAVTREKLHRMTCDEDGTSLNLIEEVAPHWRRVAKTFKIKEFFIFADRNIPEMSASVVLTRLYDAGYKGELGWQGVLNVLKDAEAGKIYDTLDRALNCVVKD